MTTYTIRSREGITFITRAATKDEALKVLEKCFFISDLCGWDPEKVTELTGVDIPELDAPGKVLQYTIDTIA